MIIAFNKPFDVLSQFTPEPGSTSRTLADFGFPAGVYPVGRLDADSEGLLLLTDEKGLVAPLLEPDRRHPRSYWAQVEGRPQEHELDPMRHGLRLGMFHALPCSVTIMDQPPPVAERVPPIRIRKTIPTTWLDMTLYEGKNRQVRKMTAHIGFPTLRLVRHSSGRLSLVDLVLRVGSWRELSARERRLLFEG
ncbi:MAG TPA: pseudouridine synthase [Bacteroidetes bacterium]|nr:pseudouridine synthase [Bacteroidota bacterium]